MAARGRAVSIEPPTAGTNSPPRGMQASILTKPESPRRCSVVGFADSTHPTRYCFAARRIERIAALMANLTLGSLGKYITRIEMYQSSTYAP